MYPGAARAAPAGPRGPAVGGSQPILSRADQITALKRQYARVIRESDLPGDMKALDLGVKMSNDAIVTLRVYLDKTFPNTTPVIQLMAAAQHPWIEPNGTVRHPAVAQAWQPYYSLASIVDEVMREFTVRPPAPPGLMPAPGAMYPTMPPAMPGPGMPPGPGPAGMPTAMPPGPTGMPPAMPPTMAPGAAAGGMPPRPAGPIGGSHPGMTGPPPYPAAGGAAGNTSRSQTQLPPVPPVFPEIETAASEVLQVWDADPEAFRKQIMSMECAVEHRTSMRAVLRDTIRSNSEKSNAILALCDQYERMYAEVASLRAVADHELEQLQDLLRARAAVLNQFSPQVVASKLGDTARGVQDESEAFARAFTEGDVPVKDFTTRFLEQRQRYHELKAKSQNIRTYGLLQPQ